MNPILDSVRAGVRRGWIELRNTMSNAGELLNSIFPAVAMLAAVVLLRGSSASGSQLSVGALSLPGALGAAVAAGGMLNATQLLTNEREDGSLLRAKAIPNGMLGYLIGKLVQVSGVVLLGFVIILVPGLFLFDGVSVNGAGGWATLLWVTLLGLAATLPIGAVLGSLFASPKTVGLVYPVIMGVIGISGIFVPITGFPRWLQLIAEVFPVYWMGLGLRSALLAPAQAAHEIGGSWQHLPTALVLGAWAVAGLVAAPVLLRRMARRESGSRLAGRREKALQRVG